MHSLGNGRNNRRSGSSKANLPCPPLRRCRRGAVLDPARGPTRWVSPPLRWRGGSPHPLRAGQPPPDTARSSNRYHRPGGRQPPAQKLVQALVEQRVLGAVLFDDRAMRWAQRRHPSRARLAPRRCLLAGIAFLCAVLSSSGNRNAPAGPELLLYARACRQDRKRACTFAFSSGISPKLTFRSANRTRAPSIFFPACSSIRAGMTPFSREWDTPRAAGRKRALDDVGVDATRTPLTRNDAGLGQLLRQVAGHRAPGLPRAHGERPYRGKAAP